MARILGEVQHEAIFEDNLSDGGKIVLFYRNPTTSERAAYANMGMVREGNKIISRKGEARLKYGIAIVTGFRFGDFLNANKEPFASDPGHKKYNEKWKELLMDGAADLVELLAVQVFDVPCSIVMEKSASAVEKGGTPSGNLQET